MIKTILLLAALASPVSSYQLSLKDPPPPPKPSRVEREPVPQLRKNHTPYIYVEGFRALRFYVPLHFLRKHDIIPGSIVPLGEARELARDMGWLPYTEEMLRKLQRLHAQDRETLDEVERAVREKLEHERKLGQ